MSCKCKSSDVVRQAKFQAALKKMDKIFDAMDKVFERLDNKLVKMTYVSPVEKVSMKCKGQKRNSNGRFA